MSHQAESVPLLSFCVPTYNRIDRLLPLVNSILRSSSGNFEIVVADNLSTDATMRELRGLGDSRLTIIQNEANYGAVFNQVNVLTQGAGTYRVLVHTVYCYSTKIQ